MPPHIKLASSEQNYPIKNNYVPFNQDSTPDYVKRIEEQRRTEEVTNAFIY